MATRPIKTLPARNSAEARTCIKIKTVFMLIFYLLIYIVATSKDLKNI
jgi:hypothetical protein